MLSKLQTCFFESGIKAFLVGGFIRDSLLGKHSYDLDIVLDSRAKNYVPAILKAFRLNVYFELETDFIYKDDFLELSYFSRYEIVSIKAGGYSFDFVPMRCELGYSNLRSPDKILFTKNLYLDALRRDFSINAIYKSLKDSKFIDPFEGRKDLKEKRLKTVLDANFKLKEDALRILRALDFALRFNLKLEKNLESALHTNYKLAATLSNFHKKRYLLKYLSSLLAKKKSADTSLLKQALSLVYDFEKELDSIFKLKFIKLTNLVLEKDSLEVLLDKRLVEFEGLELSLKEITNFIRELKARPL
ncbi:hypothetical protein BKH43_07215 [Helicobacter sp. 13S00401-1]|uniref:CCA tRNA nucleotidyltransferase n=1 Tax=Helicobacter sp. 13S00401-1 TaxID=1905758 RepID=UPI000BA6A2DC|nr:CCA tRNA nucleotidyltransferase [Helicobacter sp. 13S00401-1]PAF49030.1 hypothetical protein BKH43_07215 [Helicobacter sp. 13S00401-1]